jgi:hypothetical protein
MSSTVNAVEPSATDQFNRSEPAGTDSPIPGFGFNYGVLPITRRTSTFSEFRKHENEEAASGGGRLPRKQPSQGGDQWTLAKPI